MNAKPPPSLFLDLHVLVSHAPANLNRDDVGAPKSVVFGGVRRLRISSQCLKRTWRLAPGFRSEVPESALAHRTAQLRKLIEERPEVKGLSDKAREGFDVLLHSLGTAPKEADVSAEPQEGAESEEETRHLLFLSDEEANAYAQFAAENQERLEQVIVEKRETPKASGTGKRGKPQPPSQSVETTVRKTDPKKLKQMQGELDDRLAMVPRPVDVALFGRFLTSPGLPNVDAALQVAHGLGVEPAVIEPDYFTAVDDLANTAGAGHLGETELAASVFYKYAACDLRLLVQNLCPRTRVQTESRKENHDAGVSQDDIDKEKARAIELAGNAIKGLVVAAARAVPTGMKNSTAPQNPADVVHVVLRKDAPMSLANAFLAPVRPDGEQSSMELAQARLFGTEKPLRATYGDAECEPVDFTLVVGKAGSPTLTDLVTRVSDAVKAALRADRLLKAWGTE